MRRVLLALGIRGAGGNYETVRRRIDELGIDRSHLNTPVRSPVWDLDDEELTSAVRDAASLTDVLRRFSIRSTFNTRNVLRKRIHALGLATDHFDELRPHKGGLHPANPPTPLEEILVRNSSYRKCSDLRERLIREGLKQRRCEQCGRSEWNGLSIPLELDHVNGIRDDNRLENLRILCPNCHSQTSTFRGRNIGRYERAPVPQMAEGSGLNPLSVWVRLPPGARATKVGDGQRRFAI